MLTYEPHGTANLAQICSRANTDRPGLALLHDMPTFCETCAYKAATVGSDLLFGTPPDKLNKALRRLG